MEAILLGIFKYLIITMIVFGFIIFLVIDTFFKYSTWYLKFKYIAKKLLTIMAVLVFLDVAIYLILLLTLN